MLISLLMTKLVLCFKSRYRLKRYPTHPNSSQNLPCFRRPTAPFSARLCICPQSLEESHATELKELKEEHETQISQVLAQFTNETEMLVSFKAVRRI